jgi:hypothetical protein
MSALPEISAILARHVRSAQVPSQARAVTRRAVMDAIGVMSAASGLGEGCEAFAAVIVPPCLNTGFSLAMPSMLESARGPSSRSMRTGSPFFCGISTVIISSLKFPFS